MTICKKCNLDIEDFDRCPRCNEPVEPDCSVSNQAGINMRDVVAENIHIHHGSGSSCCNECHLVLHHGGSAAVCCPGCKQYFCYPRCFNARVGLCHACARGCPRVVLSWQGADTQTWYLFLMVAATIGFGRAKQSQNPKVDLTLRLLPCKPECDYPAQYKKNEVISRFQGELQIGATRVKMVRRGNSELYLNGAAIPKKGGERGIEQDEFNFSLTKELAMNGQIIRYSGRVAAIILRRVNNAPHHLYCLLTPEAIQPISHEWLPLELMYAGNQLWGGETQQQAFELKHGVIIQRTSGTITCNDLDEDHFTRW